MTESSLMQNLEECYTTFGRFQTMGISLSIDDFGTGYSSSNYLAHLPVNTVKIDQSFVTEVPYGPDNAAIVTATITMAHNMQR